MRPDAVGTRPITALAAIMVVVFFAFTFEVDRTIKLIGLGLSAAVFIDATVVRMVLVPATMELLGRRNWWMPRWLGTVLRVAEAEPTPKIEAPPVPVV